ncbi:hypothetical protein CDL15_Pgr009821 [Punica granatum]|nr:hypothetical protein CDL15_Pgr009821 [Punica granatum]
MAVEFKVEVVSKETIKPSSPTPEEFKSTFRLSLFDQLTFTLYSPILLFYSGGGGEGGGDAGGLELVSDKSRRLKSSLSDALTRFYPLAGRIKDNSWINCSDDGVPYVEAKVNCLLEDVLAKPDPVELKKFLPIAVESLEAGTGSLLLVKASFFNCGGLAIGVCISHKITDVAGLGTFIRAWVGSARVESSDEVVVPDFTISSAFPPRDDLKDLPVAELPKGQCVTRRYVFDSSKVTALRAKASSPTVPQPTRVEAVSALIWKSVSNASRRKLSAPSRQSVLSQAVNLRRRLAHPLPEHSVGNLVGGFMARNEDPGTDLLCLVSNLRASMKDYVESYPKRLQGGLESTAKAVFEAGVQFGSLMNSDDIDFYNCSSWCGLPFYEADFGWGKPVWVGRDESEFKNSFVLIDAKDGEGIEVWLTLTERDMAELDHDQELLEFTSLNPSITW